jgi:hypothetical protein
LPKIKAVITDYIGTLANARNYSMEALKIKLHKILTETGFETSMEEFLAEYTRTHENTVLCATES